MIGANRHVGLQMDRTTVPGLAGVWAIFCMQQGGDSSVDQVGVLDDGGS